MIPVQIIRVGLGDEAIQVPVFRLPYLGGQDSFTKLGGFFTSKSGEYGVIVDAELGPEQAYAFVMEEIRNNAKAIAALVTQQFEELSKKAAQEREQRSAAS